MSRLTERNSDGKVLGVSNASYMSYDELTAIFEKLAHYEDLEEQGRLIELPCKVGDTVYLIGKNYHKCPNHYDCEHYDHEEYLIIWCERNCPNGFRGTGVIQAIVETIEINREQVLVQLNAHDNYLRVPIASVFLTKEEAESKLAELKNRDAINTEVNYSDAMNVYRELNTHDREKTVSELAELKGTEG